MAGLGFCSPFVSSYGREPDSGVDAGDVVFLTHQRSSQLILEPRCIQKLLAIEGKMLHELKEEIANGANT